MVVVLSDRFLAESPKYPLRSPKVAWGIFWWGQLHEFHPVQSHFQRFQPLAIENKSKFWSSDGRWRRLFYRPCAARRRSTCNLDIGNSEVRQTTTRVA